jgi:hypothetical protein
MASCPAFRGYRNWTLRQWKSKPSCACSALMDRAQVCNTSMPTVVSSFSASSPVVGGASTGSTTLPTTPVDVRTPTSTTSSRCQVLRRPMQDLRMIATPWWARSVSPGAASTVAAADVERPGPLGAPRWGVSRRSGWPSWSTLGPLVLVSDSPATGGPSSCPRPAGPAAGGRQAGGRAGQTTWRSACRCVCVATTTAITSSGTPGRGAVAAHHVHPRRPSPGQAR